MRQAEQKSTRILVTKCYWGDIHTGTKDDLIAAGLAQADWFPGLPGNMKTTQTIVMVNGKPELVRPKNQSYKKLRDGSSWIKITRDGRHRFDVRVPLKSDEEDQRKEGLEMDEVLAQPALLMARACLLAIAFRAGFVIRFQGSAA